METQTLPNSTNPTPITEQILTQLKSLNDRQVANEKSLDEIKTRRNETPFVRKGENIMNSRGFQFSRVIGVCNHKLDKSNAKVELELCERLQKEYVERGMYQKHDANNIVVPFSTELMALGDPSMEKLSQEVSEIVKAGAVGGDRDELIATIQKAYGFGRTKSLSWMEEAGLGALVGPPVFGEPIELLRNQEVFLKAGARVIPFPPSGRVTYPRMTGATSAYWVGSGVNDRTLTASEPTTGDVVMNVKKLAVLVKIPNELFRFPTVSVEQIIRADMMRSAALKMDKAFLEGTGSAFEPKGLINYAGINAYTASTVGANGNTFEPEDIHRVIGTIEEQNVEFKTWVGRPLFYAGLANRRADAVSAGDKKGMFLFNALRDQGNNNGGALNNSTGKLEGYDFLKTNQVSKTRTKGSASDLTYLLGGNFDQVLVALSGVMEFAVTALGDTPFTADQSWIRCITWCDLGVRHEEAFALIDQLIVN